MLVKLEAKTSRAKSLAFHPKRPWILAALHSGAVQLWDYRMGTMLDEYHEHEGPARGCAFHPTQPIFASCGDDYTVRVYNYRTKRQLFCLTGHMDYVRSVQFHPEAPWLMSASDDQTVRIWNWQSRQCISVLTGHSHYVMCAQFHPKEDLVVSASLDQTIRVWDISGLKRKGTSASASPIGGSASNAYPAMSPRTSGQLDLFAPPDGAVKYILEGHERGVNWVVFHPTKPLIASASDDRTVKLWRFNDIRAWEMDTLRGHQNNVSAVIFHPKLDLLFSDSEDKTMKIWDISSAASSSSGSGNTASKKAQTVRREDRFWSLAAHPDASLMAFGHDEGFSVFKMEPERPPFVVSENHVFYFTDKVLKAFPLSGESGKSQALMTADHRIGLPATLSHSPAEEAVLLTMNNTASPQGKYELYCLRSGDIKHGNGAFGVFTAKNRFAVLDTASNTVNVMTMDNAVYRSVGVDAFTVKRLLPAFTGAVLLVGDEQTILWDLQQNREIYKFNTSGVKYVSWSADHQRFALLCKKTIHTIDRRSGQVLCTIEEPNQVKSAVWSDDGNVLFYTNAHHLKYAIMPSGDSGVLCTIDRPFYLLRVQDESVFVIDRQGALQVITIDPTEHQFKLALQQEDHQRVNEIIQSSPLVGQAIISYLRKKGFARVALEFVQDAGSRFELALEAGRLDLAVVEAERLSNKQCWLRLGEEAMLAGDINVAETAYKRGGFEEKLSFLLLVTGQFEKLRHLQVNQSQRVHNQMMLGDWSDLCAALSDTPLAGIAEAAEQVKRHPCKYRVTEMTTRWPLTEQLSHSPHIASFVGNNDDTVQGEECEEVRPVVAPPMAEQGGWGDDDLLIMSDHEDDNVRGSFEVIESSFDNDDNTNSSNGNITGHIGFGQVLPGPAKPIYMIPSDTPRNCIINGDFEKCKQLLSDDHNIANFDPLLPTIERVVMTGRLYHEYGSMPVVPCLQLDDHNCDPFMDSLQSNFESAMSSVTSGQFKEAKALFESCLHSSLFINDHTYSEKIRSECGVYLQALQIELTRRELPADDHKRALELASYFTHYPVRLEHHRLSLRAAMTMAYKQQCYRLAGKLARRLLDTCTDLDGLQEQVVVMARKVLSAAEKTKSDDPITIEYDGMRQPFVVCMKRMQQITAVMGKCDCCGATFGDSGHLCTVCQLSMV